MKRFVLMTVGFARPTPEIMESWTRWMKSIEDRTETRIGLRGGKEVTATGIEDLPMDKDAMTGCMIILAKDLNEAIAVAQSCPAITSTRVYEVH